MKIEIKKIHEDAIIPTYAHESDAGADLYSTENVTIYPGSVVAVSTGIALQIPNNYVGLIHPRSGLAYNKMTTVLNSPGTIDSGYNGEIKVILINQNKWEPLVIKKGDRIAQLVVQAVEKVSFIEVEEISSSDRGAGGFGSTGE